MLKMKQIGLSASYISSFGSFVNRDDPVKRMINSSSTIDATSGITVEPLIAFTVSPGGSRL